MIARLRQTLTTPEIRRLCTRLLHRPVHTATFIWDVCVRSDCSDVGNPRLIVSILDDGHSEALYGEQERAEEAVLVG